MNHELPSVFTSTEWEHSETEIKMELKPGYRPQQLASCWKSSYSARSEAADENRQYREIPCLPSWTKAEHIARQSGRSCSWSLHNNLLSNTHTEAEQGLFSHYIASKEHPLTLFISPIRYQRCIANIWRDITLSNGPWCPNVDSIFVCRFFFFFWDNEWKVHSFIFFLSHLSLAGHSRRSWSQSHLTGQVGNPLQG